MEISPSNPLYRKAFNHYLRRGIAMETLLKAAIKEQRPTTHYIWRTRGDGNVRASHRLNNGRVFAWDSPPPTGHPGEDYGCRCEAEPYYSKVNESLEQDVVSIVDSGARRWQVYDFAWHYYFGNGQPVKLSNVGQQHAIIKRCEDHVFRGVEKQVLKDARETLSGALSDTFGNSYDFSNVSWSHGRSTVKGIYSGLVTKNGNSLTVDVLVTYNFEDVFTDPLDIRESGEIGTSDPSLASVEELANSEVGGERYRIYDSWQTRIHATVDVDASVSRFR